MSGLHRAIARRDKNEREIVTAFRRAGAAVERLSGKGAPDLVVGFRQRTMLVEVKTSTGDLTPAQREWHARWPGSRVHIVRGIADVVTLLLSPEEST